MLNVLTILCFVLARVFRHRVALMIILLVLGIGLLVYSIIYSFRTIEIYHEFQDWEQRRRKKDTNGEKTG